MLEMKTFARHLCVPFLILTTTTATTAATPPARPSPVNAGKTPRASATTAPATEAPEDRSPREQAATPTVDALDYGYLFWPGNHWYTYSQYQPIRHIRTGHYGLALDVTDFSLDHLGIIALPSTEEEAQLEDVSMISSLPAASITYEVVIGDDTHAATSFSCPGENQTNPSRLVDMGRFMQLVDVPDVAYGSNADLTGSVQIAAGTRHVALTHRVAAPAGGDDLTVRITISGPAVADYPETAFLRDDRAMRISDASGDGWTLILPEMANADPEVVRTAGGGVTLEATFASPSEGAILSLPMIAVPSTAGGDEQLSVWLDPLETVQVASDQMFLDGSGGTQLETATWDPERGVHVIQLSDLGEVGGPGNRAWGDPAHHNWYNRHRIVLTNETSESIAIPMVFEAGNNAAVYIVGGSPMFRDVDGEPIGAPMQISKNWHESPFWYHLHSALTVEPGSHEIEHTFAHSRWGSAYAAAHGQLSLIGWGRNQQWDESSLGAFGESITYDPDITLNRATVDDIRPFLVDTRGEWDWTGNVGGLNFLLYRSGTTTGHRDEHRMGRLRTRYRATGPNLTDVSYAGITRDGRIEGRVTTQLGRTDDLVRVYYHLEYEFLEDVEYQRIAFFQMAADRYGDNGFTRYAYGNADEVVFDQDIPVHGTNGYESDAVRGIPLEGTDPWAMLYHNVRDDGNLPEYLADIGFVVRDYEAVIGGETVTTPHINIRRTLNGGWSQMAFELGIPDDPADRLIPAGSTFRATVEYLVPPSVKARYYGPSDYLQALPAESYRTTAMMMELATGNHLEVQMETGTLTRTHPVEIESAPGSTAAQFTITGGLGFLPITVHGLPAHDTWRLEILTNDVWTDLDQAVHGNDYWQAVHDPITQSWSLTWNVPNRGTNTYRLVGAHGGGCTGDLNGDGRVDAADLGIVIGTWNTPDGQGDVNGDGTVNAADLGIVIGVWGNCP